MTTDLEQTWAFVNAYIENLNGSFNDRALSRHYLDKHLRKLHQRIDRRRWQPELRAA